MLGSGFKFSSSSETVCPLVILMITMYNVLFMCEEGTGDAWVWVQVQFQ